MRASGTRGGTSHARQDSAEKASCGLVRAVGTTGGLRFAAAGRHEIGNGQSHTEAKSQTAVRHVSRLHRAQRTLVHRQKAERRRTNHPGHQAGALGQPAGRNQGQSFRFRGSPDHDALGHPATTGAARAESLFGGHVAPRRAGQGPAQDAGVDRLPSAFGAHEHDHLQSARRSAARRAVARLSGSALAHARLPVFHDRAVEGSESVSRLEITRVRTTARREHADQSGGRRVLPRGRAAFGFAAGAAHAIALLDQHGVRPVGRRATLVAGSGAATGAARLAALGRRLDSRRSASARRAARVVSRRLPAGHGGRDRKFGCRHLGAAERPLVALRCRGQAARAISPNRLVGLQVDPARRKRVRGRHGRPGRRATSRTGARRRDRVSAQRTGTLALAGFRQFLQLGSAAATSAHVRSDARPIRIRRRRRAARPGAGHVGTLFHAQRARSGTRTARTERTGLHSREPRRGVARTAPSPPPKPRKARLPSRPPPNSTKRTC